ncbi:hypothetical protein NDU88_001761 [Pleurodeles waltl]|uniref:Endonuclease/exonuclease/phosphatase domain-containing protein n=1 Tax=Pleurodeles waltl TaxID=8319 RepID=A0AAV7UTR5_PLEWA|nr:hypothetical protein NDU88_001761 [Pleurodeles waltl]
MQTGEGPFSVAYWEAALIWASGELAGGGGWFCSGMPGNDVGRMLGAMTAVSCLTWNVRGLNDQRKVRHVSAYIQKHRIDVCLLQETHLVAQSMKRLRAVCAAGRDVVGQALPVGVSVRA